jgi:hypothetical protein
MLLVCASSAVCANAARVPKLPGALTPADANALRAASEPDLVKFSGVLRTAEGVPVAGVQVHAENEFGGGSSTTGSDGSFSFQVPTGEDSLGVVAEANGSFEPEVLHLPRFLQINGRVNVEHEMQEEITLPASVALTAVVKDSGGDPVEGSAVYPASNYQTGLSYEPIAGVVASVLETPTDATTNSEGHATIYAVPASSIGVRIEGPEGYAPQTTSVNAEQTTEFDVTLASSSTSSQSIMFSTAAPASPNVGSVYTVGASASSRLPVELSIDAASTKKACVLEGTAVSFKRAGTCIIDANQAGNGSYSAAPEQQQTITVSAAKASTTTTLSLSSHAVEYANEGGLVANVTLTAAGGGAIPKGKVSVLAGGKRLCIVKFVDGSGSCSSARPLKPGSYSVTAVFSGQHHFGASSSNTEPLEVS